LTVFVDTSALYAVIDRADPIHASMAARFRELATRTPVTHNYVVVESAALVARRLGSEAARDLLVDVLAPVEIVWIDETIHRAAAGAYLAGGRDGPSLVDCASFEIMRRRGIREALAVDRHFVDAGFELVA